MSKGNDIMRKRLAKKSLHHKWHENQRKNLLKLLSPCAFCLYYRTVSKEIYLMPEKTCELCSIDEDLCGEQGKKGLIGRLHQKYGNIVLKDIEKNDYLQVQDALKKMIDDT